MPNPFEGQIDFDALAKTIAKGKEPSIDAELMPDAMPEPMRRFGDISPEIEAAYPPRVPAVEIPEEEGAISRFVGQAGVGFVETAASFPKALEWASNTIIGDDPAISKFAPRSGILEEFNDNMDEWVQQRTPEDMDLSDQIARGIGGIPLFFIPAMGAAKAAQAAQVAANIARWFGIGTMAVLDSASAAGSVYSDELKKTGDADVASSAASKTFLLNMPVSVVLDRVGIFGDVSRTGAAGVVERATKSAAAGAVGAGIMSPAISKFKDEEISAEQVLDSMIVGSTVAGLMGSGVQLLNNYTGKPSDFIADDAELDTQVDAAHASKELKASTTLDKEAAATEAISEDALNELINLNKKTDELNTVLARDEASKQTGIEDFQLKTEDELIAQFVEDRNASPEVMKIISEKIFDLYDLRRLQSTEIREELLAQQNPITSDLSPAEKSAGAINSLLRRAEMAETLDLAKEERLRKSPQGRSALREWLGTQEVEPTVIERISDVYDMQMKRQEVGTLSAKEEMLLIEDTRKEAIKLANKDTDEFVKSLPDDQEAVTAIVDEVTTRYKNSPLGNKLKELESAPEPDTKIIKATKDALDKSSVGKKLKAAQQKQDKVNKKTKPKKEVRKAVEDKKKPKKQSKKAQNIAKLRSRRTELIKQREILDERIYQSEIALQDATPKHLDMLEKADVLDAELSQIAFELNERTDIKLHDVTQVIPDFLRMVKDVTTDPLQIVEGLEKVGGVVYKTGMAFKEFVTRMKVALGDAFEQFVSGMSDLFNKVRSKLIEERGSIEFYKKTRITPDDSPDDAARIIEDADKSFSTLEEGDVRRDFTRAIKMIDGTIVEGESYTDIGNHAQESPIQELGYVIPGGVEGKPIFVPASDWAPGVKAENTSIKLKNAKTTTETIHAQMRAKEIEKGGFNRPINTSEGAVTIGDLKATLKKIKSKAKAGGISIDDYFRKLGFSESAIKEFMAIDELQLRGRNVIKKMTEHQIKLFDHYEVENGVVIADVMKTLGIAEPPEGQKLSYRDAAKINSHIINELGVKSGEVIDLEVMLDSIADGTRYVDKRNEAQKTLGFVRDLFLSPKQVLSRLSTDKVVSNGELLYRVFDRMQVFKEKEFAHIYEKNGFNLDSIMKLIKPDAPSNEKIALVLDGQKKAEGYLNADEKIAAEKIREVFDYMAERFVELKVKNKQEEGLVRQLADRFRVTDEENIKTLRKEVDPLIKDLSKGGKEAFDLLRMKVDNYLPHIFDRGEIIKQMAEKLQKIKDAEGADSPQAQKLKHTISRLEGGEFIMNNEIPREFRFVHGEKRIGAEGYKLDAGFALQQYMHSWAKKVYVEPAVNAAKDLYVKLPPEQKSYAKWFIMEMAGRNKRHPGSAIVSQLEWIRLLGFSLGSALTNATGIVNTITEGGTRPHAWEGFKRALTTEGRQEFYSTGMARSIPQIVTIQEVPHTIEKIRTVAGVFFNTVERGLRNHAYHTGKAQGEAMGLTGDDLIWHSIDFVSKTQHRYGVVGMAKGMRGWGGVATQFTSYPIKQAELIYNWLKEPGGVLKVAGYMGISAGVNVTMEELFGIDVSNALGIGITYGELMETGVSMTKGEWEDAAKHWELTWSGGHGILPSSIIPAGPFIGLLGEIHDTNSPRYLSRIGGELTPVMANKVVDFYYALKDGDASQDKFPVYAFEAKDFAGKLAEGPKDLKYNLGLRNLVLRTFGPKPSAETAMQAEAFSRFADDKQIMKILKRFDKAMLNGDSSEIKRLFHMYPGIVYDRGTGGALRLRDKLTRTRVERDLDRKKRQRQRASLRL